MTARATLANAAWLASSLPAHRRFKRALRDPGAAQAAWLQTHLARNGASAYGRTYGGPRIANYDTFARNVPLVTYEELAPWIERICAGDSSVLTEEDVTRLVPTSGSSGARKLIPFTKGLQREFSAAIGPWLVDLCAQFPSIAFGSAYWSVTPMGERGSEQSSKVPIGFDDDREYLGGTRAWLIDGILAVPSTVRFISDLPTFRHAVLVHLLGRRDLRFISIWHPSFLSLLLETLQRDWSALLARLPGQTDPRRLAELRGADPSRPHSIWPHLSVVSCWSDARAEPAAVELQRRLPHVALQSKGLLATEAVVTLPFSGAHPVAVTSHFFEFLDDAGKVHPVDNVRAGNDYEVIVTTGGGLWRYRLGDRVRVTGFLERTPTLRFLGRSGNVSDRCGEKLADAFVGQILGELFPQACFAMLAPEFDDGHWRYVLYSESPTAVADRHALDAALSANPNYALCRRLGQLGAPRLVPVRDAYARFTAAEMARGRRLGDIKPTALSQRSDWAEHLEREPAREHCRR